MVRTRADATARKAVAAKAPRKVLGSSSAGSSCAGLASPSGKAAKYAGGNSACPRPVPEWQKGIGSFLVQSSKPKDKENAAPVEQGESSAGGSCSQGSSSSTSEACSSSGPSSPPQKNGIISDDED